jgi:hypothetical protein
LTVPFRLSQPFSQIPHHQSIIDPSKFYLIDHFILSKDYFLTFLKIFITLRILDHLNTDQNLIPLSKRLIFESLPTKRNNFDTLLSYYYPLSFPSFRRINQFWKQMETLMLLQLKTVSKPFFFPFTTILKQVIDSTSSNTKNTRNLLQATNKKPEKILYTTRNELEFSVTISLTPNSKLNLLFQHPTRNIIQQTSHIFKSPTN